MLNLKDFEGVTHQPLGPRCRRVHTEKVARSCSNSLCPAACAKSSAVSPRSFLRGVIKMVGMVRVLGFFECRFFCKFLGSFRSS